MNQGFLRYQNWETKRWFHWHPLRILTTLYSLLKTGLFHFEARPFLSKVFKTNVTNLQRSCNLPAVAIKLSSSKQCVSVNLTVIRSMNC